VLGHCNADTGAKDKYPGFTLALAEEFDAPIDLDKDPIWTWSDGGPPEGQARFNKSQITFASGQMIITAIAMNVPPSLSYSEPDQNKTTGTASGRAVLSGEFRTKYNNYRYGRYEAKFQAPIENGGTGADGNFLSTLFTFRTPKWKEWRELDFEMEANIKTKVAWNMVNANGATGYPGGDASNGAPAGIANFNIQQMHTYIIEWTPTKVTWYTDGVVVNTNPPGAKAIPVLSAKIMMNLWVFGSAGAFGNPANNKYPFHSTYEYFRFYKWNQETMYPVADPKTLPTTDVIYSQNNSGETVYP
jgi:beta-glucanase (GH16 family)